MDIYKSLQQRPFSPYHEPLSEATAHFFNSRVYDAFLYRQVDGKKHTEVDEPVWQRLYMRDVGLCFGNCV